MSKRKITVRFLRHGASVDSICCWSSLGTRCWGGLNLKTAFTALYIGLLQKFSEELSLLICKIKASVISPDVTVHFPSRFGTRHLPHIIMCKNIFSCDKTAWNTLVEKSSSSKAIGFFWRRWWCDRLNGFCLLVHLALISFEEQLF